MFDVFRYSLLRNLYQNTHFRMYKDFFPSSRVRSEKKMREKSMAWTISDSRWVKFKLIKTLYYSSLQRRKEICSWQGD